MSMRGSMLEQAFSKSAFLVMENAPFLVCKYWKTHLFYTLNYRKTHLSEFVNIGKRTKLTIRNIGKHIFLVFWNIWNTHLDDDKLHFMFRFWRLCILVLLYCKHVRHALFSKARCWIDRRFRTGMGVKSLRDNFLALPTNIISVGKVFFYGLMWTVLWDFA